MSGNQSLKQIKVSLDFGSQSIFVGRLAIRDRVIYFQYDPEFLDRGFDISPLKLALSSELYSFQPRLFEGLPGVFNDSLPDGWGRLLVDRHLRSLGIIPEEFSALDRLAFVGQTGLGALTYLPDHTFEEKADDIDLDLLANDMREVLEGESTSVLERLIQLNGSSAGARPKALVGVNADFSQIIHGNHIIDPGFQHWLVKFANSTDGNDAGAIEYVYSLMANEAGVEMAATHLFPALKGGGYFATRRFDREANERLHLHTASGLLHSDFRVPSLDYEDLIALTEYLTKDVREVEKMFRLAVFNVLAHNRDDHGKNFSFLMDATGTWRLSPAYDLTFSSGPRGHMSTMIMGEGMSPELSHIKSLGKIAGLDARLVLEIIDQTQSALSRWSTLSRNYGVSKTNQRLIQSRLNLLGRS